MANSERDQGHSDKASAELLRRATRYLTGEVTTAPAQAFLDEWRAFVTRSAGTSITSLEVANAIAFLESAKDSEEIGSFTKARMSEIAMLIRELDRRPPPVAFSASVPPDAINALAELVRLKRLKERNEKDIPNTFTGHTADHWQRVQEYERDKEDAWAFAKSVVDAAKATDSPTDSRVTPK